MSQWLWLYRGRGVCLSSLMFCECVSESASLPEPGAVVGAFRGDALQPHEDLTALVALWGRLVMDDIARPVAGGETISPSTHSTPPPKLDNLGGGGHSIVPKITSANAASASP